MNQFSLNLQPSDTLWYTPMEHHQVHHHQQPPPPPPQQKSYPFFYQNYDDADSDNSSSNANNADRSETTSSTTTATLDKEHMFEKPLTPSDVGKLNRLVIPKQHAEKYFPLAAATAAAANDSTAAAGGGSGTGGLLLGFEDEAGKCWRFRYSYWNSSQSYVLTKGWSRYVKEKKLDAGDVVLFERHRFDSDRFFIGWRRRGSNPPVQPSAGWTARSSSSSSYNFNQNHGNNYHQNVVQSQQNYAASHQISAFPNYPHHHPESPHAGTVQVRQKAKKSGGMNSKRVRLFGVNLECQLEDEDEQVVVDDEPSPQTSDGSSLSSQGGHGHGLGSNSTMGHHTTSYNYFDYMGYPQHNHMDMNFSTR